MIKRFLASALLALSTFVALPAGAQWSPGPGVEAEPIGHITVYGELDPAWDSVQMVVGIGQPLGPESLFDDPVYVVALVVSKVRAKCYSEGAGTTKNTDPSERAAIANSLITQTSSRIQRTVSGLYTNVEITWADGSKETFAYNLWSVNSIAFTPGSGNASDPAGACTT